MKRTPLYEKHIASGARMAPFGGFEMPIQYTGIINEHHATRTSVTLFDTCHMGEFLIEGSTALADLENLLSCDVASMAPGQCRYGFLCNQAGGVIDDQILYRRGPNSFYMVVNAGTRDGDYHWIDGHRSSATTLLNLSDETAKIDIQGPASPALMNGLLDTPVTGIRYYRHADNNFRGEPVLVSRTGYTGELGFEIYLSPVAACRFWDEALDAGALPAGLGARDTLRLEMGYPLYGHELNSTRNAAESGFNRAISSTKQFIGAGAVRAPGAVRRTLCGILLDGRRAARAADIVTAADGTPVGEVTSGSFSPSLQRAIALAIIDTGFARPDTRLSISSGSSSLTGVVVETPFYSAATGRNALT